LTDVPEGTIVRVITRLDETCREVRDAARVIGDADLFTKMEEAQALIKRDSESSLPKGNGVRADVDSRFRCQFGMSY
jgi:antiviral helicase SKI2